jgi:hypothetical protein
MYLIVYGRYAALCHGPSPRRRDRRQQDGHPHQDRRQQAGVETVMVMMMVVVLEIPVMMFCLG